MSEGKTSTCDPVSRGLSRRALWLLALAVAVLAVLPRLEPALRGFNQSPDAAEYLLIARSLRGGEGFQLPIRVRYSGVAPDAPARHEAYGERAPLYPWALSLFVSPERGWPTATLQLTGVALAALAAVLAFGLTWVLAFRRGLPPVSASLAALVGGLSVAWQPFLVRASIHLWAEPLGLCLVLGALALALWERGGWPRLLLLAIPLVLARHARPEAWVLAPLVLIWLGHHEGFKAAAKVALGVAVLEGGIFALTGTLAPQLELFAVGDYRQLMGPDVSQGPSVVQVLGGVGRNAIHQIEAVLLPKNAAAIVPLALFALRRQATRLPQALAGGLALATILVWSTDDPSRFTIAPLCLLALPAAPELVSLVREWAPAQRRRVALAVVLGAWLGVLGHAGGRSMRGRSQGEPSLPFAQEGTPTLADPWTYALATGQPARLAAPRPEKERPEQENQ
ncbi:MAG: hypothetical protein JKY65_19795 [Planctomycetes bacterium]|nr:hypothetical protein [Planctomycetota bacterium]